MSDIDELKKELDAIGARMTFVELKLTALEDLFVGYLKNERAALMSVAKYVETRITSEREAKLAVLEVPWKCPWMTTGRPRQCEKPKADIRVVWTETHHHRPAEWQ